jgi:hypothetical protein
MLEGGERQVQYLVPDAVYLASPEVHGLLGVHVCYVEKTPSELSRKLGKDVAPDARPSGILGVL